MHGSGKTSFKLRDFRNSERDYAPLVAVAAAVWPDYPRTVGQLRRGDRQRDPASVFGRSVAELDGAVVAYAVYGQNEGSLRPGTYFFQADVHPSHRRQGIGSALYDHLLDRLSRHRPARLTTMTRDDHAGARIFLEKRGFELVLRRPVMRLDVQSFDVARFRKARRHGRKQSFTVSPLRALISATPDWKRRCWDLEWDIVRDIPTAETPARRTLDRYSLVFEEPHFTPEAWFIAISGDEWIGMSTLWPAPSSPEIIYVGITGVRRDFRRRGVATAMKMRSIEYARAHGAHVLETDNEENNPMRDLNVALGFDQAAAWLDFRRSL